MHREFFVLANEREAQRSSATLSGMSGRQNEKAQADGVGESGNRITHDLASVPDTPAQCSPSISGTIGQNSWRY